MVKFSVVAFLFFLVFADLVVTSLTNKSVTKATNQFKTEKTKKSRKWSTSSSNERTKEESSSTSDESKQSLELSTSSVSSSKSDSKSKKKYQPKSSIERTGWRKWHRKCTPCPEDQPKKWRDRTIKWICGQFQRARRSFKSLCMMHYRNCQDGTMFTKIHDQRCDNETDGIHPVHGEHFFYEYKADATDESSSSSSSGSSTIDSSSSEQSSSSSSSSI